MYFRVPKTTRLATCHSNMHLIVDMGSSKSKTACEPELAWHMPPILLHGCREWHCGE
jgi:hypothetical protein